MGSYEDVHAQLLSLMEEALEVCIALQNFSKQKFPFSSDDDDHIIIEAIEDRESIINVLINLEYRIDLILDEVDEYDSGDALPVEVEKVRQTILTVLSSVSAMDTKAMTLVSSKMQSYRDETLTARNKKHISAYITTGLETPASSSYDFKK